MPHNSFTQYESCPNQQKLLTAASEAACLCNICPIPKAEGFQERNRLTYSIWYSMGGITVLTYKDKLNLRCTFEVPAKAVHYPN